MIQKQARVKIVRTIKILGHPCKDCEWTNPPVVFNGMVNEAGMIEWPIAFGYRITYCPHCGKPLPRNYPIKEVK